MEDLSIGLLWYAIFVFSTTVHEAAHAFAAFKLGDMTAYHAGQVTLDPTPHIRREPIGMIVVPIVTFFLSGWMMGWASCPYDPVWAAHHPKRAAWMGLAGPASNLGLVIIAAILIHIGILGGFFFAPEVINFTTVVESHSEGLIKGIAIMLSIMFTLNLALFVFNLIPVSPLDGTALLEFALKDKALYKYRQIIRNPSSHLIGLIIAWNLFGYIFNPVHTLALNLLYPGSEYY